MEAPEAACRESVAAACQPHLIPKQLETHLGVLRKIEFWVEEWFHQFVILTTVYIS